MDIEASLRRVEGVLRSAVEREARAAFPRGGVGGRMGRAVAAWTARGGLRRGLLTAAAGRGTGRGDEEWMPAAVAVELVHAASLLHDDWIDGGTVRRGEPALWTRLGGAAATVAGDALLCRALAVAEKCGEGAALLRAAAETCRGEWKQDVGEKGDFGAEKTGALFGFAAGAGAGGAGKERAALERWGRRIGTAYQALDDWRDGGRPGARPGFPGRAAGVPAALREWVLAYGEMVWGRGSD